MSPLSIPLFLIPRGFRARTFKQRDATPGTKSFERERRDTAGCVYRQNKRMGDGAVRSGARITPFNKSERERERSRSSRHGIVKVEIIKAATSNDMINIIWLYLEK